jgi:hypothetical protein
MEKLMTYKSHRNLTAILLIAAPVLFLTAFTLLQVNFEYPDILRKPAAYIMERFVAGGSGLIANWYVMALSAMMFVPIAVLLHPYLAKEKTWLMPVATTFGVLAGVVQTLGFIRWPFLVPYLARTYLDPFSSELTRETIAVTFSAFNQYAGSGIGEHLGYLFTALWSLLTAGVMLNSPGFGRWVGWIGIISSLGILLGTLEPAGVPFAGLVNAMAYVLWAVWLVVVGAFVLRLKVEN